MGRTYCENGKLNLYEYEPSIVAAVIFAVIFAALTAGHVFRMIRSRQWFLTALVVGGGFEIVGFVIRITGHNDPCVRITYILQTVLILIAPAIFSATIYMILGRTVRAIQGDALSPIRPTRLTKIFVAGDVLCFFVQGGGGGILSSADNDKTKANLGKYVILAGLALQIVLFGLFIIVALIFHSRIRKQPTPKSTRPEIQWQTMLHVLYGVSLLIMVRNLFRVVEYGLGRDGYLLSHEWPLYVFDAALMSLVMAALLWWFPTMIRPKEVYGMDDLEPRPTVNGSPGYQQSPSPASSHQPHLQK
ncbi:hypothetical protein LTR84_011410 [Exophiala bonariae]|uniref:RTA1-domain-containing protein n=1 Tax=Exophiala bonariae TaxID=1690606 RepID=A0AAV9MUH2_9EURO|nr:hypothetical protein LTR84_011410 [Exophiala bonariae]